jgi:hypothetical protein
VDLFGSTVPVEFAQPFASQMRFAEAEAEQEFQIGMAILGPDLQEVGRPHGIPITPTLGELHAEGWEGIVHIAGTVGLYAKEAGAHEISIRIDGTHSWSIPLRVLYAAEGVVETE